MEEDPRRALARRGFFYECAKPSTTIV